MASSYDKEFTAQEILNRVFNENTNVLDTSASLSLEATGLATEAKQDTIIGHIDGVESALTAIQTAVEGTLTVTGGGGGTEYTEDVATANPIVGTATMIERDDALSEVTPIEGDNIGLRGTAEGALWTQDFNSDAILADTTAILADTAAIEIATEATQAALETVGGLVVNLGANNDVTVTGTVDLGATDNGVLDTIDAVLDTINAKLVTGTDIGDVTINNSTGASAVNIQDGGNTITVDGTVAVTNAGLTELAAAINSDKVDVNIVSSSVATGGTSAADDDDFTDGTTPGTPAMGVYESTPSTVTDGDLGLVGITEDRRLKVLADLSATDNAVLDNIDSDLTTIIGHVDGLETLIGTTNTTLTTIDGRVDGIEALLGTIDTDTSGIITAVQLIDDAIFAEDVASQAADKGIQVLAIRDDTLDARSGTEGDYEPLHTDANGALWVNLVETSLAVTGTVDLGATDNGVLDTIDAVLDTINAKLVTGTDIGDVTINNASGGSAVNIQDGGNVITVDGSVTVDMGANNDVTVTSGAITETNSGTINTAVQLIDDAIFVDDADWTADTSKHALVGAVTQVATTANTDGDTTPLTTNAHRELRVAYPESDLPTAGTAHVKKYYTNAGAVTDGIIWSPAAGKRWFVTDLIINVSAAATVTLEDDKSGGDEAVMKFELAANSGISHSFQTPWFSGEDAADLIITTSAGNVYVTAVGYEV